MDTGGIDELKFVDYVAHISRARTLRHATRESCIISSRLAALTYNKLGMRAWPVPMGVKAMNAYTHQYMMVEGKPYDPTNDRLFTVGVEHEHTAHEHDWDKQGWWNAHLCLVVENRYLVDASCDQMSWPHRGVVLAPFAVELDDPDAFLYGGKEVRLVGDNGQVAYYDAHPDDTSYMQSSDWAESVEGEPYYEAVVPGTLDLIETCKAMGTLPGKPPLPESISLRPDRPVTQAQIDTARAGFDDLELVARQLGKDLGPSAQGARAFLAQAEQQLAQGQQPTGPGPAVSSPPSSP